MPSPPPIVLVSNATPNPIVNPVMTLAALRATPDASGMGPNVAPPPDPHLQLGDPSIALDYVISV